MFGGAGGFDPKKMQAMMKQLGMKQEDIDASKVIIEKNDGNKIVIENPSVARITVQGQETYQISGDSTEQEGISEEDVKAVMEKANVDSKEARKALKENNGDLAEAILSLS